MSEQAYTTVIFSGNAGPCSASHEERALDQVVESVIGLFEQAARGQHTAWALSEAMASIMSPRHQCSGLMLNDRQRERLLGAIAAAHGKAIDTLPPLCRRSKITVGMEALAGLVVYWAESGKQRAAWPRDGYIDLQATARILRNDLHNLSLLEGIEERAHRRRAQVLDSLLLRAPNNSLLGRGSKTQSTDERLPE